MKLPSLDPSTFSQLLGVVSDVTLVMDLQGTIEDVSTGRDTLAALGWAAGTAGVPADEGRRP